MKWIEREEVQREWGNVAEWISLLFLILSLFPLHFLILSSFPRSPAARLQRFVQPCWEIYIYVCFSASASTGLSELFLINAKKNKKNLIFLQIYKPKPHNVSWQREVQWEKRTLAKKHPFLIQILVWEETQRREHFLISFTTRIPSLIFPVLIATRKKSHKFDIIWTDL